MLLGLKFEQLYQPAIRGRQNNEMIRCWFRNMVFPIPKSELIYLLQHRTLVYGSFWLYVPCNWQVAEILLKNSPGPICFTFLVHCTSFANLVNFNNDIIYVPGCRPQHESHYHYWFVLHFCFSQRSFLCIGECLKCVGSNVCLNNKGIFFSIVTSFIVGDIHCAALMFIVHSVYQC